MIQQLVTCQCDVIKLGKMVVLTSIHMYMENHDLHGRIRSSQHAGTMPGDSGCEAHGGALKKRSW